MTPNGWLLLGLGMLLGAALASWVSFRLASARYGKRARKAVDDLQQKHASTAEQLRLAQTRSSAEMEQARSAFKRQLATATDEPRAALARVEERLKAAYAELDRLRAGSGAPDTAAADLADGFAATRPMHAGM
jgi:uncharacterized membrane protein YccC